MTDAARERAERQAEDTLALEWSTRDEKLLANAVLALVEENERLESYFADVFDGSPQDFVEGYKEMEGENERLRGTLRNISHTDDASQARQLAELALTGVSE